jgi:hypothetical protein
MMLGFSFVAVVFDFLDFVAMAAEGAFEALAASSRFQTTCKYMLIKHTRFGLLRCAFVVGLIDDSCSRCWK